MNKVTKKIERKQVHRVYFKDSAFPSGWLFSKIIPTLKSLNLEYQLIDNRQKLSLNPLNLNLPFELREYQKEAIELATKKERGILALCTGSGKTALSANIIAHYGLPTLYIVPSLNLINQTAKFFNEYFGSGFVGYIGDGQMELSLINIATQQTLWSRRSNPVIRSMMDRVEVLILDEAHKVEKPTKQNNWLGNTWYTMAMRCENARIRLGMTATPGKAGQYSRELLEAITGKILYEVSSSDLISKGYLAKPTVYVYDIPIQYRLYEWSKAYDLNILQNSYRNNLIAEEALKYANMGKKVVIVVDRIEKHGKIFEDLLGDRMESMYGNDNSEKRIAIFERFRKGETKIVVSTTIREGVDIPEMDVIILANAGKGGENHRKTVQIIGRVLRKSDGKDTAVIIDFYDKDNGMLEKHAKERLKVYNKEEEYVVVRR